MGGAAVGQPGDGPLAHPGGGAPVPYGGKQVRLLMRSGKGVELISVIFIQLFKLTLAIPLQQSQYYHVVFLRHFMWSARTVIGLALSTSNDRPVHYATRCAGTHGPIGYARAGATRRTATSFTPNFPTPTSISGTRAPRAGSRVARTRCKRKADRPHRNRPRRCLVRGLSGGFSAIPAITAADLCPCIASDATRGRERPLRVSSCLPLAYPAKHCATV